MKKYIKIFLFSFIIFCSIFFVNNCSAVEPADIVDYVSSCYAEGYKGTNLEPINNKTVTLGDLSYYPYTAEKRTAFINDTSNVSEFNNYDSFLVFSYYQSSTVYTFSIILYNSSDFPNGVYICPNGSHSLTFINNNNKNISCYSFNGYSETGSINNYSSSIVGFGYYNSPPANNCILFSNTNINYSSNTSLSNTYLAYEPYVIYTPLTIIDNPNSDVVITYEYNQDFSSCHVNATIRNGAFSDKLYYSYQMPSIAGQGLTLGKTAFPSERFRYYK